RSLAGLLEAVLLPLLHPGVTGEEAGLLQRRAVHLDVEGRQRTGEAHAQRAGLAGHATAVDPGDDVELALRTERHQRLVDHLLVDLVREVRVRRAAVEDPLAGARPDADTGDRLLAAARAVGAARRDRSLRGVGADGGLGGVLRRVVLGVVR